MCHFENGPYKVGVRFEAKAVFIQTHTVSGPEEWASRGYGKIKTLFTQGECIPLKCQLIDLSIMSF